MDRFWKRVDIGGEDECWEWQGGVSGNGYGYITVDGNSITVHRMSYELECGEVEDQVLHTCDNRTCVNPNHLYDGTQSQNMRDAYDRDRREPLRGASNGSSDLDEEDVKEIRSRVEKGDETQVEIAEDFGISQSSVSRIALEDRWNHVSP